MHEAKFPPFLRWPDENTGEMDRLRARFPMELGVLLDRYVDPFVGGGSMLFEVMSVSGMKEAVISDINPGLINMYRQLKTHTDELLADLQMLEDYFSVRSWAEKVEFYRTSRLRYSYLGESAREDVLIRRAAVFIFHNAIGCLSEGDSGAVQTERGNEVIFPKRALKDPRICNERQLRLAARLLQNVEILCGDFRECLRYVDARTFLYLDPPAAGTEAGGGPEVGHGISYAFSAQDMKAAVSVAKIASGLGAEVLTGPFMPSLSEKNTHDKK